MGRFQTKFRHAGISLATLALLTSSGCATTGRVADGQLSEDARSAAPLPSSAAVRATMRRAADWQLAHMGANAGVIRSPSKETFNPRGWVMGTFYIGLYDWAKLSGDRAYLERLFGIAEANRWQLGVRPYHADDQLVGLLYTKLASENASRANLAPTRAYFDAILADPPRVGLQMGAESAAVPCQRRWCWIDALFMAPASWFALSRATGDDRYAAYADKEFWATTDYLGDADSGLFYRDSTFFGKRGDEGEKIFWSRGNGWIYGGIVNLLRAMPDDDPRRARYLALFRAMSARLVALQRPSGSWNASLLATADAAPETSGTGFFTYGLAWGVNQGLLTEPRYTAAALKGWAVLDRSVMTDGRLGNVQQVGDRPGHVLPDDTQFYGVGALLLAGDQIARMGRTDRRD